MVGPGGPDAASIGLDLAGAAMDAETEAEAGPVTDAPDETPVVDVALAESRRRPRRQTAAGRG